ncbi:hypothetical protein JCM3770_000649 [Rhodotorula araucariae]
MPAPGTPATDTSWSRSLRDSDDDSCDDSAPPPRLKRTRTTSSDTDRFTWGSGADLVDIGLVSEPADLKFVETPFTLAKNTGARRNSAGGKGGGDGRGSGKGLKAPRSIVKAAHIKATPPVNSSLMTSTPKNRLTPAATSAQSASASRTALRPPPSRPPLARPAGVQPDTQSVSSAPTKLNALPRSNRPPSLLGSPARPPAASNSASSASYSVVTPAVATATSKLAPSPVPPAPLPPRSPAPLRIRTDSPSPKLPIFQAALVRPKPGKQFVSPIRPVQQLRPTSKTAVAKPAAPAAPAASRLNVLPLMHDTLCKKLATTHSPASSVEPSQVVPNPARPSTYSNSRASLQRFRHIGTFSSTVAASPPASSPPAAAVRSSQDALSASPSQAQPDVVPVVRAAIAAQPRIDSPSASSPSAAAPSHSSGTFRLPGLAPPSTLSSTAPHSASRPRGRLAFTPTESLTAFRARTARESAPSSSSPSIGAVTSSGGRKRARDAAGGDCEAGRERVVLGTTVRSVRPVFPQGVDGAARGRNGGMGRGVTTPAAPRRAGPPEGAESAEARLRRLYRSFQRG